MVRKDVDVDVPIYDDIINIDDDTDTIEPFIDELGICLCGDPLKRKRHGRGKHR